MFTELKKLWSSAYSFPFRTCRLCVSFVCHQRSAQLHGQRVRLFVLQEEPRRAEYDCRVGQWQRSFITWRGEETMHLWSFSQHLKWFVLQVVRLSQMLASCLTPGCSGNCRGGHYDDEIVATVGWLLDARHGCIDDLAEHTWGFHQQTSRARENMLWETIIIQSSRIHCSSPSDSETHISLQSHLKCFAFAGRTLDSVSRIFLSFHDCVSIGQALMQLATQPEADGAVDVRRASCR